MIDNLNEIEWLSQWYQNNCNENWEHIFGISIRTIDNPGWAITIDLEDTDSNLQEMAWQYFETNDNDWYGYKVEDSKFEASGDPSKLNLLIRVFKNLIDQLE